MKGAIGFLVGLIGLCSFGGMIVPLVFLLRRYDELVIPVCCLAGFVFLNIMVVGFYRIIGHLHETVLYPDDAYHYPQRGRVLFFVGYMGLLVMLVFPVLLVVASEFSRLHFFRGPAYQILLVISWIAAWAFLGCFLGGILAMLNDVYHKAFYRTAVDTPRRDLDDELGISRQGSRRRPNQEERARDWES